MAVDVVISYDGTDITDNVLFQTATFESQLSATPGMFEFTCKDSEQVLSFTTGKEVTLDINGTRFFGGYLTQVSETLAFPVDDTRTFGPQEVKTRQWVLRGVDYNILFDKRVLRSPSNYKAQLKSFDEDRYDGDLIKNELCPKYLDLPAGFDYTTHVDNVATLAPYSTSGVVAWLQQGSTWREQMVDFAAFSGAVWYINANKQLVWKALEDAVSPWGFSDVPNRLPVTGSGLPTYGFREMTGTEDGTFIINDFLVWGGGEFVNEGSVVFARAQNQESIDRHNRWQMSETHFGESPNYSQARVNARSQLILDGSPTQQGDRLYGLKFPQWQFRFAWFDHHVPEVGGTPDFPYPGTLFTIILYTFGTDGAHPLIQQLPLRSVRVSFPELDGTGLAHARFEGFFGIQQNDPWTLWRFLLQNQRTVQRQALSSVNNTSESASYGAFGSFYPNESPDGTRTTFTLKFGYIAGTTNVTLSGLFQRPSVEYYESNPAAGEITFISAPLPTDWIWVTCLCMSG